tara:strand:- start:3898 stop:4104 length:207 start_codon:yes stop_codon:yes gene_type:complete
MRNATGKINGLRIPIPLAKSENMAFDLEFKGHIFSARSARAFAKGLNKIELSICMFYAIAEMKANDQL